MVIISNGCSNVNFFLMKILRTASCCNEVSHDLVLIKKPELLLHHFHGMVTTPAIWYLIYLDPWLGSLLIYEFSLK